MDLKVITLCYILPLLFLVSSAEDVTLSVRGVTNIATTDENFICATLDWWPSNKCDYNQCPWGQAGILNLVFIFYLITQSVIFPLISMHSLIIRVTISCYVYATFAGLGKQDFIKCY